MFEPVLCAQLQLQLHAPPPVPFSPQVPGVAKMEKRLEDMAHKWDEIKKAQPQVRQRLQCTRSKALMMMQLPQPGGTSTCSDASDTRR